MQKSIGFPQGTEQLGVAARRENIANAIWKHHTKLNVQNGPTNSQPSDEILKHLGSDSRHSSIKHGISCKYKQLESQGHQQFLEWSRERGAQYVDATTHDHSESRRILEGYQLCASASTFTPGDEVEGGGGGGGGGGGARDIVYFIRIV